MPAVPALAAGRPLLLVGATAAAIGLAGLAVGFHARRLAARLPQRLMQKALKDPAPSQVESTFSVQC